MEQHGLTCRIRRARRVPRVIAKQAVIPIAVAIGNAAAASVVIVPAATVRAAIIHVAMVFAVTVPAVRPQTARVASTEGVSCVEETQIKLVAMEQHVMIKMMNNVAVTVMVQYARGPVVIIGIVNIAMELGVLIVFEKRTIMKNC